MCKEERRREERRREEKRREERRGEIRRGKIREEEHNRKKKRGKAEPSETSFVFPHLLHVTAIMLAAIVSWLLLCLL